jgi:hypothetical protein
MPKCTYCGGTAWIGGPSGGMSQNILCANPACRHWFNYAEGLMFDDLKNQEPTAAEAEAQAAAAEVAKKQKISQEISQGRRIHTDGKGIEECFVDELAGYTAVSHGDLHRLAAGRDGVPKPGL